MIHLQIHDAANRLALEPAVLVRVQQVEGSAPRGVGTWMLVFAQQVVGTIGGGHLELEAIARARQRLRTEMRESEDQRFALGPSLGQCCGGVVHVRYEALGAQDAPQLAARLMPHLQPLALFGGGHVGSAIVNVVSTLPFAITWIDSRDDIFPEEVPGNVHCEQSDPVHAAVADLASGSQVLVMSFSHAEDLDIVAACLARQRERQDLGFIGLIGSKTKWATFRHRLEHRGFTAHEIARITCPIGLPGIEGKEPEVIAVSVAAQLLRERAYT